MSPESVAFSSKYPTGENAYFEWKQKRTVFLHLYLNANKLLLPRPFSRIAAFTACISDTLLKNICLVLIIMLILLKSCVLKPYPFNLISTHIRSTCTESVCHRKQVLFHVLLHLHGQIHKLFGLIWGCLIHYLTNPIHYKFRQIKDLICYDINNECCFLP